MSDALDDSDNSAGDPATVVWDKSSDDGSQQEATDEDPSQSESESEPESDDVDFEDDRSHSSFVRSLVDAYALARAFHGEDFSDDSEYGVIRWGAKDDELYDIEFPQFMRFPIEIRQKIWEFFCPDLRAKTRVLYLDLGLTSLDVWVPPTFKPQATPGFYLEQQTMRARIGLAVHHESRAFFLRSFPDTLELSGHGIIRFNAEKDVILTTLTSGSYEDVPAFQAIPGVSEKIKHIALMSDIGLPQTENGSLVELFEEAYPNLKTLYYAINGAREWMRWMRWCGSTKVKHYFTQTWETLGPSRTCQVDDHVHCLPDLEKHLDFANENIPLWPLARRLGAYGEAPDGSFCAFGANDRMKVWPMFIFSNDEGEEGMQIFERLVELDGKDDVVLSSDDSLEEESPDEYDSSGIDDSEIEDEVSEADSDLNVVDDAESASDDGDGHGEESDHGSATGSLAHPVVDQNGATFSSPEPELSTIQASDSEPVNARPPLKRKRNIVADSDDEGDEEMGGNEAGPSNAGLSTANKRRTLVVDSDDEDEAEEEIEGRGKKISKGKSRTTYEARVQDSDSDSSADSESQEDGEEDDDKDVEKRPLTLAEKLQLDRTSNPVPSDSDESGREGSGSEDEHEGFSVPEDDDEEGDEALDEQGQMDPWSNEEWED